MKVINLKLFFLLFFLLSQPISSKNIEFIEKIYEYKNNKNIDIFFGQLKNKKKSGIGRFITNHGEDNQEVYYGEFKNDQKHGHGVIYYSSTNDKLLTCGLFNREKIKSIMIKFQNGDGYFGDLNTKRLDSNNFGVYMLNQGGYEIGSYNNDILLNNIGAIYDSENNLLDYGAYNNGIKIDNFFVDGKFESFLHWFDRAKKNAEKAREDCDIAKNIKEVVLNNIPLEKKFYND